MTIKFGFKKTRNLTNLSSKLPYALCR